MNCFEYYRIGDRDPNNKDGRFETWNGRLMIPDSILSKGCINDYFGYELRDYQKLGLEPYKKYRILRLPQALEAAISTFNMVPLQSNHKNADPDKIDKLAVIGSIGQDVRWEYPYVKGTLIVSDKTYIDAIKSGRIVELSPSYDYKITMKPGTFNGEPYDGVMTDIMVDHVALVERGRTGRDVRVGDQENNMTTLNKTGRRLLTAMHAIINPSGRAGDSRDQDLADVIAQTSGMKKKHIPYALNGILVGRGIANDEEAREATEEVKKALDEECNKASDEDTIDTADDEETTEDKDKKAQDEQSAPAPMTLVPTEPIKDTIEVQTPSKAQDSAPDEVCLLKKQLAELQAQRASDSETLERRLREDFARLDEAKELVRPVLGTVRAADSGEAILRDAYKTLSGKTPSDAMPYCDLKNCVTTFIEMKNTQAPRAGDRAIDSKVMDNLGANRLVKG